MKRCDHLAYTPLEGGRVARKLEINSKPSTGEQMTLVAVAGSGDSELVAHLLRTMLGERKGEAFRVQSLLGRMEEEGCTHVVLQLDDTGLERREYAGLHMSVTALTGPTGHREELAQLLGASDTVVLNLDERAWEDYGGIIPEYTFTYSENKTQADLTAKNLRLYPSHMEFEAVAVGHIQRIHLPVPGGFSLYHGLCALACGLCLGLKWERMARVLRCVHGPQRRLEVLSVPAAYTVVLDRAPQALEQLLTCAREFTAGQLICVLSCPEQGGAELCAQLGGVAEQLADRIILTGSEQLGQDCAGAIRRVRSGMGGWQRPCREESCRRRAITYALEKAGAGDVIVLTGQEPQQDYAPDEREFVHAFVCRRHGRRGKGALTGN